MRMKTYMWPLQRVVVDGKEFYVRFLYDENYMVYFLLRSELSEPAKPHNTYQQDLPFEEELDEGIPLCDSNGDHIGLPREYLVGLLNGSSVEELKNELLHMWCFNYSIMQKILEKF